MSSRFMDIARPPAGSGVTLTPASPAQSVYQAETPEPAAPPPVPSLPSPVISDGWSSGGVTSSGGGAGGGGGWRRPFAGLLVFVLLVGTGLFFLQQSHNSKQNANFNALNNKIKANQQSIKSTNNSISQNASLQTLSVSGQTTLNQLDVTNIKAGNLTVDKINGSTYTPSTTAPSTTISGGTNTTQIVTTTFSGAYIARIGAVSGLSVSGNGGHGSSPHLSVVYGASGGTAVQGSVTLKCPAGGTNLTGGGNTLTLGNGGSCNNLSVVSSPSFAGNVTVSGTLSVASSKLTVNSSGDLSTSGTLAVTGSGDSGSSPGVLFKNAANATNALQIQDKNGTVLFDADTTNGRVGIKTATPGYALDVNGFVNANELLIDGTPACSESTFGDAGTLSCVGSGGAGSPNYIQNQTSSGQNANFWLKPSDDSTVAEMLQVTDTSQTVNVFEVVSSDATPVVLASIGPKGDLTVQSATFHGHLITGNNGGGTTLVTLGAKGGTGGTPSANLSGNDTAGTITIHTGTSGVDAGDIADIVFAHDYDSGSHPRIYITPDDSGSAALQLFRVEGATPAHGFSVYANIKPFANTTYTFDYLVVE